MPNWCYTNYKVIGDEKQLKELFNAIDILDKMDRPFVENGFGNLWLGCLVTYLGGDWEKVACRGEITSYDKYSDSLSIATETAWAECHEVRKFLEEKFPKLEFYYISEESGMCEYYTNDKSGEVFRTRYRVDLEIGDNYLCDDCFTLQEAADMINSMKIEGLHVEPSLEAIRKALKDYEEEHEEEDCYGNIYEYEIED